MSPFPYCNLFYCQAKLLKIVAHTLQHSRVSQSLPSPFYSHHSTEAVLAKDTPLNNSNGHCPSSPHLNLSLFNTIVLLPSQNTPFPGVFNPVLSLHLPLLCKWDAHSFMGLIWYRPCFPRQTHLSPCHIQVMLQSMKLLSVSIASQFYFSSGLCTSY